MDKRKDYAVFKVTKGTMKYLQDMKKAFELSYQKEMTNDEFIMQMAASVEAGDLGAWELLCQMQMDEKHLVEMAEKRRKQEK